MKKVIIAGSAKRTSAPITDGVKRSPILLILIISWPAYVCIMTLGNIPTAVVQMNVHNETCVNAAMALTKANGTTGTKWINSK